LPPLARCVGADTMNDSILAEVALYPLREADIGPILLEFVARLREAGLEVEPGPMSTLVKGPRAEVFAAVEAAFAAAGEQRQVVLRLTVTNAKP